jgi:hypothetical protein
MSTKSLFVLPLMLITRIVFAGTPAETASLEDAPCATMMKFGAGTQAIPIHGKVQTRFQDGHPVSCGSMIITHTEAAWMRASDQTVMKIAPNSFFELGKKGAPHRLYRGKLLVTAPPSIQNLNFTTPNGEVSFKGGVAWIEYDPAVRETVTAAFNRSFEFKNKFKAEAFQKVQAGEISRLIVSEERVIPTQPVVMSPSSVKQALMGFSLVEDEQRELVEVVERVFEGRAKSLASDIESWEQIPEETPQRSIASKKASKPAIDVDEARFSMGLLKQRLYGDENELKMLDDETRKPASIQNLDDPEYERQKKVKKSETQRLIDEVSKMK